MENVKDRGKIYAMHKASDKLNDYYGNAMLSVVQFDGYDIQRAYVDGYLQAEQDLEPKEVDLEAEFDNYTKDILACDIQFEPFTHLHNCAKYFYELGLKAKGE